MYSALSALLVNTLLLFEDPHKKRTPLNVKCKNLYNQDTYFCPTVIRKYREVCISGHLPNQGTYLFTSPKNVSTLILGFHFTKTVKFVYSGHPSQANDAHSDCPAARW